jgi:hypothetical protein
VCPVTKVLVRVREVLDAHLMGRPPEATAIEDLNAASTAAPQSTRLGADGQLEVRYHAEYGGNAKLAAIARRYEKARK